jgi:hypothetical protein
MIYQYLLLKISFINDQFCYPPPLIHSLIFFAIDCFLSLKEKKIYIRNDREWGVTKLVDVKRK